MKAKDWFILIFCTNMLTVFNLLLRAAIIKLALIIIELSSLLLYTTLYHHYFNNMDIFSVFTAGLFIGGFIIVYYHVQF